MRILFLGDIFAKPGREKTISLVPVLRRHYAIDCVIVNGENAAHGFGLSPTIADSLFACGIDVITNGNHAWDRKEIIPYMAGQPRLLRPLNDRDSAPGKGVVDITTSSGHRVLVINLMLRLFMQTPHDPWDRLRPLLGGVCPKQAGFDAVVLDIHGEATSEKQGFGRLVDGQASLVVGTHTHVPTADARILPQGTAYQTDAGMCGDYDSIIGMKVETAIGRFRADMGKTRLEPAEGVATIAGVLVETAPDTGLATRIARVMTDQTAEQLDATLTALAAQHQPSSMPISPPPSSVSPPSPPASPQTMETALPDWSSSALG